MPVSNLKCYIFPNLFPAYIIVENPNISMTEMTAFDRYAVSGALCTAVLPFETAKPLTVIQHNAEFRIAVSNPWHYIFLRL